MISFHPNDQLIVNNGFTQIAKRLPWGDPLQLEHIHTTLKKHFLCRRPTGEIDFNEKFHSIDKEVTQSVSQLGFSKILTNTGLNLRKNDSELLFQFYDREGHGSMDFNDFLVGIRHNLNMQESERKRIMSKLRHAIHQMGGSPSNLPVFLQRHGLPTDHITERDFVASIRLSAPQACTTSDLLFLFSLKAGPNRHSIIDIEQVLELFHEPQTKLPESPSRSINIQEVHRKLGHALYNEDAQVSGRLGLLRMFRRVDRDFDGVVDRPEFVRAASTITRLPEHELAAWFDSHDSFGKGEISVACLLDQFKIREFLNVTPDRVKSAMDKLRDVVIRKGAKGIPGIHRIFEKQDIYSNEMLTVVQLSRALRDLGAVELKDIDVEILHNYMGNGASTVNWKHLLEEATGYTAVQHAQSLEREYKSSNPAYLEELRLRMSEVLQDPDRQSQGSLGLLRIERIFDRHDINHTGVLALPEFRKALASLPKPDSSKVSLSDIDIELVFKQFDNGNGVVNYKEFIKEMMRTVTSRDSDAKQQRKAREKAEDEALNGIVDIQQLQETIAKVLYGSDKNAAGTVGLLRLFSRFDKDGDGVLDRREFHATVQMLGPKLTKRELDALFDYYDRDGTNSLSTKEFLQSMQPKRNTQVSDEQFKALLAHLSRSLREQGAGNPKSIKRVFDKIDRSGNGKLNLGEFVKAIRSLGCEPIHVSDLDLEKIYNYYEAQHGVPNGMTFQKFFDSCRGFVASPPERSISELLHIIRQTIYGRNGSGSLTIKRVLHKSIRSGGTNMDFKDFLIAMQTLGMNFPEADLKRIFNYFDVNGYGSVSVNHIIDELRRFPQPTLTAPEAHGLLRTLAPSISHRQQGLGGFQQAFVPYDFNKNGTVDLGGFAKAIRFVASSKLSDFEIERLFQYYSDGGDYVQYMRFVEDFNSHQAFHTNPKASSPPSVTRAADNNIPTFISSNTQSLPHGVVNPSKLKEKLWAVMYDPARQGLGTMRLQTYFTRIDRGNWKLTRQSWFEAVRGLMQHDGFLLDEEINSLFDILEENGMIDAKKVLQEARYKHNITLSDLDYSRILQRLWETFRWRCRLTPGMIKQMVFEGIVSRQDGKAELPEFSTAMMRWERDIYDELQVELIFNRFSPDRVLVDLEKIEQAFYPPPKQKATIEPLITPESQILFQQLSSQLYQGANGSLAVRRALKRCDRDGDQRINRREFQLAMNALGVSLSSEELDNIFNALSYSDDNMIIHRFVENAKRIAVESDPNPNEFLDVLAQLKVELPSLSNPQVIPRSFTKYDLTGEGHLDLLSFTKAMDEILPSNSILTALHIEKVFDALDHGDGLINYREFQHRVMTAPVIEGLQKKLTVPVQTPYNNAVPISRPMAMIDLREDNMQHFRRNTRPDSRPAAGGSPSLQAQKAGMPRCAIDSITPFSASHYQVGISSPQSITRQAWNYGNESPTYYERIVRPDDVRSESVVSSALPNNLHEAVDMPELLHMLHLDKYIPLFEQHEIDLVALPELTHDELTSIGLPIGPTKKVLKAAKLL